MLDEIALKLRRSRHTGPIFGTRVTVVADTSRAMEHAALAYPAAYVCFLGETAEAQPPGSNAFTQRVTQSLGIVVGLEATADIRGQNAVHRVEDIRAQLCRAIYNWKPDRNHGALFYGGFNLLGINRAVTYWTFTFGSYWAICEDDGEHEEQFDPLPEFLGINRIYHDYISPHDPGNPPSEIYTPPIGPSRGPAPWPTGPEGRIEHESTVDFDGLPPRRGKANGKR